MALNFPASPSTGDVHNASNGVSYHFDGVKWISQGAYNTSTINTLNFTQQGTGAVSRSIQNKLEDVVSIKDFGATADSTTDDAPFIDAAITYAIANGKRVYIPAGTYSIQTRVHVTNVTTSIDIDCEAGVKFVGTDADVFQTQQMFNFTTTILILHPLCLILQPLSYFYTTIF